MNKITEIAVDSITDEVMTRAKEYADKVCPSEHENDEWGVALEGYCEGWNCCLRMVMTAVKD